jgi:hypothetical protein
VYVVSELSKSVKRRSRLKWLSAMCDSSKLYHFRQNEVVFWNLGQFLLLFAGQKEVKENTIRADTSSTSGITT